MNEQAQDAVAEAIQYFLQIIKSTGDVVATQTPEVFKEFIMFQLLGSISYALGFGAATIVFFILGKRTMKWAEQGAKDLEGRDWDYYDSNKPDPSGRTAVGVLFYLISTLGLGNMIVIAFQSLRMVLAPKAYLLMYLVDLSK